MIYLDASAIVTLMSGRSTPYIASAQVIGDALEVLVAYDKRMLDVAHSVGLPTAAPGLA